MLHGDTDLGTRSSFKRRNARLARTILQSFIKTPSKMDTSLLEIEELESQSALSGSVLGLVGICYRRSCKFQQAFINIPLATET